MTDILITATDEAVTAITLVSPEGFGDWHGSLTDDAREWVARASFTGKAGQLVWLPDDQGRPSTVAAGWDGMDTLESLGGLPLSLPDGVYHRSRRELRRCPGRNGSAKSD
jgi:hypothetical protein